MVVVSLLPLPCYVDRVLKKVPQCKNGIGKQSCLLRHVKISELLVKNNVGEWVPLSTDLYCKLSNEWYGNNIININATENNQSLFVNSI